MQGQGVYLPLHDVAFGVSEQRIEVVGDEFGAFHHLEALLQGAELGVHEPSVFEVVEADAEFGIVGAVSCGGGHDFVLSGHLQFAQGPEAQSPAARQVVGDGGRQVEVGLHEGGADVAFGGCVGFALLALTVEVLPAEALFLKVGDAEARLAVEAVAPAGVYVHRE